VKRILSVKQGAEKEKLLFKHFKESADNEKTIIWRGGHTIRERCEKKDGGSA
jgi:hypothetical protein